MTRPQPQEAAVIAEFLKLANVTDHPYSRTPEPCCKADPMRHLGANGNPWALPPIEEMRALVEEFSR